MEVSRPEKKLEKKATKRKVKPKKDRGVGGFSLRRFGTLRQGGCAF